MDNTGDTRNGINNATSNAAYHDTCAATTRYTLKDAYSATRNATSDAYDAYDAVSSSIFEAIRAAKLPFLPSL